MSPTPQELAQLARTRSVRHQVEVSAGTAVYFEYAASQPAEHPTLVFVHGYRGDHFGLEAIVGALPDFRILNLDLPGFGQTPPLPGEHSVANYAQWLIEVVSNIAPDATVVSHSFGTLVAAKAATVGLPNQLILINPVTQSKRYGFQRLLKGCSDALYTLGGKLPDALAVPLLKNRMLVRLMSEVLAKTHNRKLRNWVHLQHRNHFSNFASKRVAIEGYFASTGSSVGEFAENIANKTLIIAADLDDVTSLKTQERILPLFASGTLRVIHGVGHLVHYETPAECASLIRDFVEGGK